MPSGVTTVGLEKIGSDLSFMSSELLRIDGKEVMAVINVNEETLQGEAVWERVPVADRPPTPGDPNYVEDLLARLPNCKPAPPPTSPQVCVISVDPSDTKTHEIPGKKPSTTHLVTVKGTGDIVLRADIVPDTPRLRSKLTWEADGAVITPAAGGRLAKISRNKPGGARIPVRLKFGGQTCTEVVVWIIWCTLEANTGPGTSSIRKDADGNPLELGPAVGHRLPAGAPKPGYVAKAVIDWTATIHPAEIIKGSDRPAIEKQVRVRPPYPSKGAPGPGIDDVDATGRGFRGWDMSQQARWKVFKGNPDKGVPIKETTAHDPEVDDQPNHDYPADDPQGNIQGSDDHGPTDEERSL